MDGLRGRCAITGRSSASLWSSLTQYCISLVEVRVQFVEGIYMEPTMRTGEMIVGTDCGVLRARSFKRLPTCAVTQIRRQRLLAQHGRRFRPGRR